MLTEYKTKTCHYYLTDKFKLQGEYKTFYPDGTISEHRSYIDGRRHGEVKSWGEDGTISYHEFFMNGVWVTKFVSEVVKDISNPTDAERMIVKLKWGIDV